MTTTEGGDTQMINNSTLSGSMSVAELVPKAATTAPAARSGDGAFGEALAGAHTVHDRRESREAAGMRRDQEPAERTRGLDRAREVRDEHADDSGRSVDAAPAGDDTRISSDDDHADEAASTDEATSADGTDAPSAEDVATPTTGVATATGDDAPTAQVTVAVAAAPAVTDLDAIIVPTGTTAQVQSDAVDAAVRMAIAADAPIDADAATTVVAPTTTTTTSDADAQLAATLAPGTEDAADGDVQAGPTRPSTSMPTTTSGPSPVQLAAATFAADDVDAAAVQQATTPTVVTTIASTDAVEVAAGEGGDAATQLVQAAAVEADAEATDADPVAVAAGAVKKSDAAPTALATDEPAIVDPDVDPNAATRPGAQSPAAAMTAAAQQQAQAKAAEQAADDGADAGTPKLEPLPLQAAATATTARTEGGIRAGAGLLTAQVQERIDHIAEQLATRLRLSQAAGGSQVQLSLKPRELGEVTVQMNVRDGVVAATILVDKADTMRTMQANIEDLKRSLEQQGLSIQQFSVDVRGEAGAGGANARAAADLRAAAARTGQGASSTVAGAAAVIPGLSGDRTVTADEAHDGDVSVLA
jgi:flagellar hook-length control protein FliK